MLDIKIFDVDHGFCATIDRHNHHTIVVDVGLNTRNGISPWQHILKPGCRTVDCLIVPAYVREHLDGIPGLLDHCLQHGITVSCLIANPTLEIENFPALKEATSWAKNPLGVTAKLHPECQRVSQSIEIDDIDICFFWNSPKHCQDPRDLSLVTFLSYEDINIILPSDLKTEGWRTLLKCDEFRDRLRRVNIFVASNHGREDGYCPEAFDFCRPDIVLVSNEANQRLSAAMLNQYQIHAKGAPDGVCDRKILTTYDNGTITVSKCLDRLREVTTQPRSHKAWAV